MDLCNENGVDKYSFGFNFYNYIDINFYPNLIPDKFDEYECWCLNNVLSRSLHNENTNYWLNPFSACVKTCIKVHNAKAVGVAKKSNKTAINNLIKLKSDNYKKY